MLEQTKIALLSMFLLASFSLNVWIIAHSDAPRKNYLDEFSECNKESKMRSKQIKYLTDENYYLSSSKSISESMEKLARCEIKLLDTNEAVKECHLNRKVN